MLSIGRRVAGLILRSTCRCFLKQDAEPASQPCMIPSDVWSAPLVPSTFHSEETPRYCARLHQGLSDGGLICAFDHFFEQLNKKATTRLDTRVRVCSELSVWAHLRYGKSSMQALIELCAGRELQIKIAPRWTDKFPPTCCKLKCACWTFFFLLFFFSPQTNTLSSCAGVRGGAVLLSVFVHVTHLLSVALPYC